MQNQIQAEICCESIPCLWTQSMLSHPRSAILPSRVVPCRKQSGQVFVLENFQKKPVSETEIISNFTNLYVPFDF